MAEKPYRMFKPVGDDAIARIAEWADLLDRFFNDSPRDGKCMIARFRSVNGPEEFRPNDMIEDLRKVQS